MATQLEQVDAKLDEIGTTVDGAVAGITQIKIDFDTTLADLKAQIAAGANPTDLTGVLSKLQGISDKLAPVADALGNLDTEITAADVKPA